MYAVEIISFFFDFKAFDLASCGVLIVRNSTAEDHHCPCEWVNFYFNLINRRRNSIGGNTVSVMPTLFITFYKDQE